MTFCSCLAKSGPQNHWQIHNTGLGRGVRRRVKRRFRDGSFHLYLGEWTRVVVFRFGGLEGQAEIRMSPGPEAQQGMGSEGSSSKRGQRNPRPHRDPRRAGSDIMDVSARFCLPGAQGERSKGSRGAHLLHP